MPPRSILRRLVRVAGEAARDQLNELKHQVVDFLSLPPEERELKARVFIASLTQKKPPPAPTPQNRYERIMSDDDDFGVDQ